MDEPGELNITGETILVHPGDIVVVQLREGRFSAPVAARLREITKPLEEKHGISFLVVDASVDLTVMRPVEPWLDRAEEEGSQ